MIAGTSVEEVHINTTIHEDNLGIIVDLLSVSIFFSKRTVQLQTESCYANLMEKHSSLIDGNIRC